VTTSTAELRQAEWSFRDRLATLEQGTMVIGLTAVLVVIGAFTNPSLFLLRAIDPRPQIGVARKAYRVASFATTTVGFAWAACSILQAL